MNDRKIGIQIKKARAEAQLTQTQLGRKIGVTWEMISRYENGKSSPRKNLEKIAKTLNKPIQYFFGVEEVPISDEIQKLSILLQRKGAELQKAGEIPYIESLAGFTLSKAIQLTSQTYSCPSWIVARFKKLFAFKLDDVTSSVVSIGKDDVGFFTKSLLPKIGNYVLVKERDRFKIEKYSKSLKKKVHAVLLAVEKRYYEN